MGLYLGIIKMKQYVIKFEMVDSLELLIEYRKTFKSLESAMEWSMLTAHTHIAYKNFEMFIRIQEIKPIKTLYYHAEQ